MSDAKRAKLNHAPAEPTGIAYPTTMEEVKAQLRAAREQANREKEEREAQKRAERALRAQAASAATTAPPSLPSVSTASSLLATRMHRATLMRERQLLEEKLSMITWIEFRKQAQAVDFVRAQRTRDREHAAPADSQLRLFAYEYGGAGRAGPRRFIVSSYGDFWVRYFTLAASQRHHYEILPEGEPCHLYFDVEFKVATNPHFAPLLSTLTQASPPQLSPSSESACVDVEAVMGALVEEIAEQLTLCFPQMPAVTPKQILQLDSSSSVKFSRHLIVRLHQQQQQAAPPAATAAAHAKITPSSSRAPPPATFMFRDNAHAGRFVRFLCQRIARQARQDEQEEQSTSASASDEAVVATDRDPVSVRRLERLRWLKYLLVREGDPHVEGTREASMIDQAVYTRNRSFRLFLSSKNTPPFPSRASTPAATELESAPVLLVAQRNTFPLGGAELRDVFMASLVCQVPCPLTDLQLLTFSELDEGAIVPASTLLEKTLEPTPMPSINASGKRAYASAPSRSCAPFASSSSTSRRFQSGSSPFPRIEAFFLKHLRSLEPHAASEPRIAGWTYFKETNAEPQPQAASSPLRHTLTLNVSGHRYCLNIGRAHRSNGVFYVLDLAGLSMHQRCWDADCRYFRSPPVSIPAWIADLDLADMARADDDDEEANEEQSAEAQALQRATASWLQRASQPPSLRTEDDDEWDLDALDQIEAQALSRLI